MIHLVSLQVNKKLLLSDTISLSWICLFNQRERLDFKRAMCVELSYCQINQSLMKKFMNLLKSWAVCKDGLCQIVCAGMLVSQEEASLPYSPIWESIQTQDCMFSSYCFTWGLVFPSGRCRLLIQHSPPDIVTWGQSRSRSDYPFFPFSVPLFTINCSEWLYNLLRDPRESNLSNHQWSH